MQHGKGHDDHWYKNFILTGVKLAGVGDYAIVVSFTKYTLIVYPKYCDSQTSTNSVDPDQMPQNMTFDDCLHHLPLAQSLCCD